MGTLLSLPLTDFLLYFRLFEGFRVIGVNIQGFWVLFEVLGRERGGGGDVLVMWVRHVW